MTLKSNAADEDPFALMDLVDLAGLFAAGAFTPLQAVDLYLSRIERLNPTLNAFLYVDRQTARLAAQASSARWAQGKPLSLLDGAPIGVKANIAVYGLPWHAGIDAYRNRVAKQDAEAIAALRQAGAIFLGLVNMHEAALGGTNDNAAFGRCHNPHRQGFSPGGSSGGSAAAVAAGLCVAALGTDTMGSVRIPAAYCGVFGHLPRRGRVSLKGVTPLAPTLDTLGVITRSARDIRAIMPVLAGETGRSAYTEVVPNNLTCGVARGARGAQVDAEVAAAFDGLLLSAIDAGADLAPLSLDFYDVVALRRQALLVVEVEALMVHEEKLAANPRGFTPELLKMFQWATEQTPAKLAAAYQYLALSADQFTKALDGFDALLTPGMGTSAFSFERGAPLGQTDFTLPANITGLAATAFPIGLNHSGMPMAGQVISTSEAVGLELAERLARPFSPPSMPFVY